MLFGKKFTLLRTLRQKKIPKIFIACFPNKLQQGKSEKHANSWHSPQNTFPPHMIECVNLNMEGGDKFQGSIKKGRDCDLNHARRINLQ